MSKKFIPLSKAAWTVEIESDLSCVPHTEPPANGQHPRANSDNIISYLASSDLGNCEVANEKIDKILSPLLIISGKNDEIVPHSHSIKLYSKAIEPKHSVFIAEAMHNNLYAFGIEKEVLKFNL